MRSTNLLTSSGYSCLTAMFCCTLGLSPSAKHALAGDAPKMDATPLIARELLFGNPDKAMPQISPDGKHLAWLADVNGVLNVWVAPVDKLDAAKPVTQDAKRGIRMFNWAFTNQHILYPQDKGGDENWRIYSTDVSKAETQDLTAFDGVQARIAQVSHRFPDEILVALNNRKPELHDIHRVNIRTGEMKPVQENTEGFAGFEVDDDMNVRFGMKITPDGGKDIMRPDGKGGWASFLKVGQEDNLTTDTAGFDKTGKSLYLMDSRGRDTAALVMLDIESGKQTILAQDDKADVGGLMVHPTENTVQAAAFNYLRNDWRVLDKSVESDLKYLRTVAEGDLHVGSRTLDDQRWIVAYDLDNGPARYYLYDRAAKKANFLFTNRSRLDGKPLAKMHSVVIKSRDGMDLVSYLTLPNWTDADDNARPDAPQSMVLLVHGGPWARDGWGFNPLHQWLANRGHAVLSVNFRSSTGFGKKFVNAGDKQWGRTMHDDLIDAVEWAVKEKIADPKKTAIMGGSYGGYATLAGVTMTPDTFACGVDIVGPSNLITLINSIPPYWKPMLDLFATRVGDPRMDDGRKMLEERSPIAHVDKIKRPLLIGQGANDPRVKQAESDQIVKAMTSKSIPVTYVLYPDEGHGFQRPENKMSFWAVTEAFLSQHLGGRAEPIGDDFKGSSITVPNGEDQVPGLSEALAAQKG